MSRYHEQNEISSNSEIYARIIRGVTINHVVMHSQSYRFRSGLGFSIRATAISMVPTIGERILRSLSESVAVGRRPEPALLPALLQVRINCNYIHG